MIMSKKMMLLALVVAALFALPSAASSQEIHFSGVTSFSGSGPAGSLAAANEPKISFTEIKSASGGFTSGSSTTGEIKLTFAGATAEFLGIKGNCNTSGDAAGVITSSATFHLITTNTGKPGILVTPVTTTIICTGFSRVEVTGPGIIGTITSPACGASSKELKVSFEAEGSTQKHMEYTDVPFDLVADTEKADGTTTGVNGTAALSASATLTSATAGTLECT
jgi:hypothetical protein